MTGSQASYLKTLSGEAHDADIFDEKLAKAEASKRIDALKAKVEQMRKKRDPAQWPAAALGLSRRDGTW